MHSRSVRAAQVSRLDCRIVPELFSGAVDRDSTVLEHITIIGYTEGCGSKLLLRHTGVPADQLGYENGGWQDNYFDPMKAYFGTQHTAPGTTSSVDG